MNNVSIDIAKVENDDSTIIDNEVHLEVRPQGVVFLTNPMYKVRIETASPKVYSIWQGTWKTPGVGESL